MIEILAEICPICKKGFDTDLGTAYDYKEELPEDHRLVKYHSECLYSYGEITRAEYDALYRRD